MIKSVSFYAAFNERTGYGIHATRFAEALEKKIKVFKNQAGGDVSITLMDSVSVQNVHSRLPHRTNILYNVWESTAQPQWFIDKLKYFDHLWVPSEWQRACSIAQGIPEEFVSVVPEGVDPTIYKPKKVEQETDAFLFLHVGQWQNRKSTLEICQSFLKAFPDNDTVRLCLSVDTLFPSDIYKSTEERLEAYGLTDSRIIPIHFEGKEQYIERLQSADCFISCSRSEGWGLPIMEAMACGVPTIVADWGGSTEYAQEALKVRVPSTKKPEGIYGGWDVPGLWGEPDYDHLVEKIKSAYEEKVAHKEKALKTAVTIRKDFSWDAAAAKAHNFLTKETEVSAADIEQEIHAYAGARGYAIKNMRKESAIFVVDCWPSSQEKMDTLIETLNQIHGLGYPVLVSSHYAVPQQVIELADFYLYEKQDIMSGDDKPIYSRTRLDGTVEHAPCNNEYQGVAALNCFRNAIDFCRSRYDWIYQMSADIEVDLEQWLRLVHGASKDMVCIPYEGVKNGIGGGLWAGRSEMLNTVIPYLTSWKQYAEMYPDVRFVAERWIYKYVSSRCNIKSSIDWIDIDTRNRFDNVDREVWADDDFQYNFVDGPFLNIIGISNREYDVVYSTPEQKNGYEVKQKAGMWSRPNVKYYQDWNIKAYLDKELKFEYDIDLKGKNVLISMGSKALGDTIAWMPYVEEFRKKHDCHVLCSGWWQQIFDYPGIEFVEPGSKVEEVFASYNVGCYDDQLDKNVKNWRETPLQKVAADILGVDYKPLRAKLKAEAHIDMHKDETFGQKPHICFSEFSTMQNKLWNREGAWQAIIDYLNGLDYTCVSVSAEKSELQNIVRHNGQSIEQTIADIARASFYIGLNHGPIWIAYALGVPAIMITGVSEEWSDFPNPYRISVDTGCKPCFNNVAVPIDRSWHWCVNENKYQCTQAITEEMVKNKINILFDNEKRNRIKK